MMCFCGNKTSQNGQADQLSLAYVECPDRTCEYMAWNETKSWLQSLIGHLARFSGDDCEIASNNGKSGKSSLSPDSFSF